MGSPAPLSPLSGHALFADFFEDGFSSSAPMVNSNNLTPSSLASGTDAPIPEPLPRRHLVVGNADAFESIQKLFEQNKCNIPIDRDPTTTTSWIRDSQVMRPDGIVLIPTSHESHSAVTLTAAKMLPPASMKLIMDKATYAAGHGMDDNHVDHAIRECNRRSLEYSIGPSCIEGGNCFIVSREGKTFALIGETSVWVTYQSMYERDELNNISTPSSGEAPSLDYIRMARNLCNHNYMRKISGKDLTDPADIDFETFFEFAHKIQANTSYVSDQIRSDLKVDAVIALQPAGFHLDLQMFVTPDGTTVFMNSISLVVDLLRDLVTKDPYFIPYLETALKLEPICKEIEDENTKRLTEAGFKVVPIPGELKVVRSYVSPESLVLLGDKDDIPKMLLYPTVNLVNGIFLENGVWLTGDIPDARFDPLKEAFERVYHEHRGEESKTWYAGGQVFRERLTLDNGGLRCCTLEERPAVVSTGE